MNTDNANTVVWKMSVLGWALVIAVMTLLGVLYYDGLVPLLNTWEGNEEYSHGYLIPLISLFMIWQHKDRLEQLEFTGSWPGFALVIFGIALFFMGELSTLYIIVQYSLLLVLSGLVLSFAGLRAFVFFLIPLLYLVFSIPLPSFLYNNLSNELQLISSELGVAVIRLFGVSVHLEGNVIDLGNLKLQVVEACSGLRYLFPLMSFAFLCAYLFKQSLWKRVVIFLSSIPITVLMNSFRIGVIGVLVDNWGTSMAQGFLHDFEGWFIFLACVAILFIEMWLLSKIGKNKPAMGELFSIHYPSPRQIDAAIHYRPIPKPFIATVVVLIVAIIGAQLQSDRVEAKLERKSFADFPVTLNDWQGKPDKLDQIYLLALDLDDYIISDYVNRKDNSQHVNFYVAYYNSQRKGESAHSPRSCIPGDGWEIQKFTQHTVEGVEYRGKPFIVNRLHIKRGNYSQLVYYWFQQRGRIINDEYQVKWYLFQDALTRNRTDGALVRLTTSIPTDMDISSGDKRLSDFAGNVITMLDTYIPE